MFSQADLQPYLNDRLVSVQTHPTHPTLRIYNYTPQCQYSRTWDTVTRTCRGLILDSETGEVIARPFAKFFNYEEYLAHAWPLPLEAPLITEKLDGALGILYWLNDEPWLATRGSFTSPQAQWGMDWLRDWLALQPQMPWSYLRNPAVTHLFEIIAPVSRVVVHYDYEGLVHLTCVDKSTGLDVLPMLFPAMIPYARQVAAEDYRTLGSQAQRNAEGFVVLFPTSGVRCKIKFTEYVRLHRLMTGLSLKALWKLLRDGTPLETMLRNVPDEFYAWVSEQIANMSAQYRLLDSRVQRDYTEALAVTLTHDYAVLEPREQRKQLALAFQEYAHPSLLFALHDHKGYAEQLWK